MGCSASSLDDAPPQPTFQRNDLMVEKVDVSLRDRTVCNFCHMDLKDNEVAPIGEELATNTTLTKLYLDCEHARRAHPRAHC